MNADDSGGDCGGVPNSVMHWMQLLGDIFREFKSIRVKSRLSGVQKAAKLVWLLGHAELIEDNSSNTFDCRNGIAV